MISGRSEKILKAAVREYVLRGLPVASEDLYERYKFGVKPASIRAELLRLTQEGFLEQPHTSGGRIPTEKGYRFFVDKISDAIYGDNVEAPLGESSLSLVREFNSGHLSEFVDRFAREMKIFSMGYEFARHEMHSRGLGEFFRSMDFTNREDFCEVAQDLERLEKNIDSLFAGLVASDLPKVFIGSESPVTKSRHLSIIADRYDDGSGKSILVVAVGPTRMDYAKPMKLMKAMKQKPKNKPK